MSLCKSGQISNCCHPERPDDPRRNTWWITPVRRQKSIGFELIEKELKKIPKEKVREIAREQILRTSRHPIAGISGSKNCIKLLKRRGAGEDKLCSEKFILPAKQTIMLSKDIVSPERVHIGFFGLQKRRKIQRSERCDRPELIPCLGNQGDHHRSGAEGHGAICRIGPVRHHRHPGN